MLDLSTLNDYLLELDFFSKSFIGQRVDKYGVEAVITKQLECLDCSKRTSKGETVQQTNGYAYRNELSQTVYIIQNYILDDDVQKREELKDWWLEKVLKLHEANLKWEVENPPTPAKYKRVKGERAPREKKESSVALKAKAKAAKIGKLSLNLKIAK